MKKIFKISGMHCTSCAMNIEWELEDKGVKAKCDYAKQCLEVDCEPGGEKGIIETVKKLGYEICP